MISTRPVQGCPGLHLVTPQSQKPIFTVGSLRVEALAAPGAVCTAHSQYKWVCPEIRGFPPCEDQKGSVLVLLGSL